MTLRLPGVSARAFSAMQVLNIAELAQYPSEEIRPFLPSLTRMALLSPMMENTPAWAESRKQILSILVGVEVVNDIVALLQVNYHEMEMEVKKEQQMRQKIGYTQQDSAQFHNLPNGVVLGFERADVSRKVRVVLSELFYIQAQIQEMVQMGTQKNLNEISIKQSELFDNDIYLKEVSDIICIILPELPSILSVQELVDILLYVNSGSQIICWIVANMPDTFKDVANALVTTGDDETADGRLRQAALYALCEMNPGQALTIRTLCVEMLKMPSLALRLSLNDGPDMISFVSGLLLGNDQQTKSWFAQFVRASQKRKIDVLQMLRDELLKQLKKFVALSSTATTIPDDIVVQAVALLKLYCALRGVAGIKFNDDETLNLMQLITSKPPLTTAGIRFVSVGLCMLIACPSLIAQPSLEAKGIEWIQKLIKDGAYFESLSTSSASFGEMLLLMAIHFHSNQLSNICELVCSTLGMKIPIRPNNTTRMKQIFIQEIFTEQVIAAHAIKVPVTPNLNANINGYLPVHCIHQLLQSRVFSKHKIKIKNWIYRQICAATTPLHPVLPSLIEAYVESTIYPDAKGPVEHTNDPIGEQELQRLFQDERIGAHIVTKKVVFAFDVDTDIDDEVQEIKVTEKLTAQLLMLYYLLYYEDVRLNNMAFFGSVCSFKDKSYSIEFLSELPIKYLLQQAQKNQHNYSGLFSSLLKLLVTHFPHLSLVDDWIDEESILHKSTTSRAITDKDIAVAFEALGRNPAKTMKLLKLMLTKSPTELWPLAKTFIRYIKSILDSSVPRLIQKVYRQIWIRLNTVLPRRLWIMTIQALMPEDAVTKNFLMKQENSIDDPLQVLRCDERVFRCADVLTIVLRILQATLAASKRQLSRHILDKPLRLPRNSQIQNEQEREDLRLALVASQESAAVQILLETCLETEKDQCLPGRKWALREVRGLVCSYIHQVFISEPSLAKLVHFQGYPRELLPITVRGIPSMHICLDFIPELLSMPEMDKQIFAIDLTSHLSLQYSLVRSLGVAKLCLNTLTTLLGVLSNDMRIQMFRPILPCIIRFGEAFPPLLDDCALFLMQLGRIVESQNALGRSQSVPALIGYLGKSRHANAKLRQISKLVEEVKDTFDQLLSKAVLKPKIY